MELVVNKAREKGIRESAVRYEYVDSFLSLVEFSVNVYVIFMYTYAIEQVQE